MAKALRWKLILYSESLSNYCGEVVIFETNATASVSASSSSSLSSSSSSSSVLTSKFTLDRKVESVQRIISRQVTAQHALYRVIFEVESAAVAFSKKPSVLQPDKSRPASAVFEDEEETKEVQERKRRREEALHLEQERNKTDFSMANDQRIDDLKRQHQASLGLLSDATIDLAKRELASGDCNYRPEASGCSGGGAGYDDEEMDEVEHTSDNWNTSLKPLINSQSSLIPSQVHSQLMSQSQSQTQTQTQTQTQGSVTQVVETRSRLFVPAKQVIPNVIGVPAMASMTIRLLIKNQPPYLLRCKNRTTHFHLPSTVDIDFQWFVCHHAFILIIELFSSNLLYCLFLQVHHGR